MPTNPRLKFKRNLAHDKATGKWHVRVQVNGRPIQKAFPSKHAAKIYLDHLSLISRGVPMKPLRPQTVKDLLAEFIEQRRLLGRSDNTIAYYEEHRQPLEAAFGDRLVDRITQADLDAYVAARRAEKVSNGTTKKQLAFLLAAYRFAEVDPGWKLPNLSHTPRRRRVHPPATVREVWSRLSPPAQCAVGLSLFAGLRAAEVWRADASWIRGSEIVVEIRKAGGDQNRTWVVETLRTILPTSGPLVAESENRIAYELGKVSTDLGIKPAYRGPGAFRHHCATYAAELGYSLEDIRLVLGHRQGGVVDRYVHSQRIERKRKVLEAVEKYVFDPKST